MSLWASGTGATGLFLSYWSHPCKLSALFFGSCVKKGPGCAFIQGIGGTVGFRGGARVLGTVSGSQVLVSNRYDDQITSAIYPFLLVCCLCNYDNSVQIFFLTTFLLLVVLKMNCRHRED